MGVVNSLPPFPPAFNHYYNPSHAGEDCMTRGTKSICLLSLAALLASCAGTAEKAAPAAPAASVLPEWTREQKVDLGRQHKTAEELYKALKEQAKGGQKL